MSAAVCWQCEEGAHRCVGFGCPCPPCATKRAPAAVNAVAQPTRPVKATAASPWHDRLSGYNQDGDAILDGVVALLKKLKEAA